MSYISAGKVSETRINLNYNFLIDIQDGHYIFRDKADCC